MRKPLSSYDLIHWHVRAVLFVTLSFLFSVPASATSIHDAAKQGDVAAIAKYLDSGADVDEIGGGAEATALYYAALVGQLDAARLLIARGADVNIPSKLGGPPIFRAAAQGHTDILVLLLANGADARSSFKADTALHKAADRGCLECVKVLIEAGADVNAINAHREPPIHFAMMKGHLAVADYLRMKGYVTPIPPAISGKLEGADIAKGEALFVNQCRNCHDGTPAMRQQSGPPLWGIVGRPAASVAEFTRYSPALKAWDGSWTYEELNAFIADPRRYMPGTGMKAEGYQDEANRVNLVAYLRTLSAQPLPLPVK